MTYSILPLILAIFAPAPVVAQVTAEEPPPAAPEKSPGEATEQAPPSVEASESAPRGEQHEGEEPGVVDSASEERSSPSPRAEASAEPPHALPPAEELPQPAPSSSDQAENAEEKVAEAERTPGPTKFKPGTGFILETADQQFSVGIRLRVQFENLTYFYQSENADGDLDAQTENTFGIRRARLQFKGHMWGKNNKYKVELALSPRDLSLQTGGGPTRTPLLSWFTEHTQLRDLSLRIGQYKLLYSRQRVISSADLEFVDRTEAQGEFNLDRDIGMHLFSDDLGGLGLFKYYAGISVAEGRDAFEAESFRNGEHPSYQPLARIEVLPFGDFKDYSEGDLEHSTKPGLSVGVAYAFTKKGARKRGYQGSEWEDGGTVDYHNVTADAIFKYKGMSAFGEFFFRDGKRHLGDVTMDGDGNPLDAGDLVPLAGIGYSVQAGYVLPMIPLNFAARYSAISRAGWSDSGTGLGNDQEVGATIGIFPGGHPFKVQADYFHLWGDSFLGSGADRIRVQFQAGF